MDSSLKTLTNKINNQTLEAFGHSLAGATASVFALCILYPLDQIKVRKAVTSQSRILTYKTIIDDFIRFDIDNILDIYRGLSFGILEQFSFNGVYFFFYEILKSKYKNKYKQQDMSWLISLTIGSIAGLLTQLFTTPLKVIQLRKQTAPLNDKSSIIHITNNIYNQHGVTGFWSGMKASVILVINPAIVQLFYDKIRTYLNLKLNKTSIYIDLFAGALSKAIATIICYPLVLIKMNLQAGNDNDSDCNEDNNINKKKVSFAVTHKNGTIRKRQSMSDIFDSTIKEKGIFGLYSGLGPKLIHASLANAITFACKEKFCIYIFAMMLYLQNIKHKRNAMQKITVQKLSDS